MSSKKEKKPQELENGQTPEETPAEAPQEPVTEPDSNQPEKTEQEALQEQLDDTTDRLLRTAAEYDNYRKRTEREKQQSVSFGISLAVERILPVLDNLERAAQAECADLDYKRGVDMTLDSLRSALTALGVSEIEAEGKPFDPEVHCAVSRGGREGAESGAVLEVVQKGYKLGDKIIRHAMVQVAE